MRATVVVLLGLLAACGPGRSVPVGEHGGTGAARRQPAPARVEFPDVEAMKRSACPYFSPQGGALLCFLKDREEYSVAVLDFGRRLRSAVPVISKDFDRESLSPVIYERDGLDTVNRELAKRPYQRSSVVYSVEIDADLPAPKGKRLADGLVVAVEGKAVTLRRGGALLERLGWDDLTFIGERCPGKDYRCGTVSFELIDAGGQLVALAVMHGPRGVDFEFTTVEVWRDRPRACPARITCPPHAERIGHVISSICSGSFDEFGFLHSVLSHVQRDAASGALDARDFGYLTRAHDALTGANLGDQAMNDFFYDPAALEWLPAACFGSFPSMKSLGIAEGAGQMELRDLAAKLP